MAQAGSWWLQRPQTILWKVTNVPKCVAGSGVSIQPCRTVLHHVKLRFQSVVMNAHGMSTNGLLDRKHCKVRRLVIIAENGRSLGSILHDPARCDALAIG
jgi:hypothetical protein